MLKGSVVFNYFNSDGSPFTERFEVEGVDTSSTMYLTLSTNSYRGMNVMAGDDDDDNAIPQRRLNIGLTGVTVERVCYTDKEGKLLRKLDYNVDFFTSLAALLRYAKQQCCNRNAKGYTGLSLASGEFIPEVTSEYNIPDDDGNILGTVKLSYGEICSLHISNTWFSVDIEEDNIECENVIRKITNSTPKTFKFNREFLGFEPYGTKDVPTGFSTGLYANLDEVVKAHPEKEFSWLLEKEYYIVTDDVLDDIIAKFESVPDDDYLFCDTETTGLNITFKSRIGQADQCVGIILSYEDGISYYFPMQMRHVPNLCGGDHWYFIEKIRKIIEGKKLVGHNSPFDWKVFHIYGLNANFVEDTMAMLALTLGNEKLDYPLGLKDNTSLLLHRDALELDDLVKGNEWGESDVNFADLPAELVKFYACADTDNTRGVFKYIVDNDILQRYNATRVYRIEVVFGLAVAYQEFYGHHIEVSEIEHLKAELKKDIDENMSKMVEIVGHDFNPNSSKQLMDIMYNQLGIPEQRDRQTGRLTTSKETLHYLNELTDIKGDKMYPFVEYLLAYRVSEGVRKIISQFDNFATPDGFVFSDVQQYGTTTGRVSIKHPNYQSYNDITKKYIRPRKGYYMADTDYSSVEYRITGNMSGNQMIKEGFYDPDFDYHTYQAARMYGVPYSLVTKELRKTAKGFNFGIPYGMGNESLGVRIFGKATEENTRKAAELHKKYFAGGQEDVEFFFESTRDKAIANGYTETYFGRRRHYHRNKFSVRAIRRQAGNAVIQGTAADIYKLAVGRMFLRVCKEGWLGKVLFPGFIHDELLLEVHESIDPMKFLKALREEFEVKIEGWCPLYMGFGWGMSWYQAKKTELPVQLQWELVDKYGETGFDKWTGDGKAFVHLVDGILRDFSIRHVANYLNAPESQGKEIKPAINSALLEVLGEDKKVYNSTIKDILKKNNISFTDADGNPVALSELRKDRVVQDVLSANIEEILSTLSKNCLNDVIRDEDGNIYLDYEEGMGIVLKSKKGVLDTQIAIDVFCKEHNYDRNAINVLNIDTSAQESMANKIDELGANDVETVSEQDLQEVADIRIDTLGMYLDIDSKEVTLKVVPNNYMAFIKEHINTTGDGYRVLFKDCDSGILYTTQTYLSSSEIQVIQQMYITYFSALKRS